MCYLLCTGFFMIPCKLILQLAYKTWGWTGERALAPLCPLVLAPFEPCVHLPLPLCPSAFTPHAFVILSLEPSHPYALSPLHPLTLAASCACIPALVPSCFFTLSLLHPPIFAPSLDFPLHPPKLVPTCPCSPALETLTLCPNTLCLLALVPFYPCSLLLLHPLMLVHLTTYI